MAEARIKVEQLQKKFDIAKRLFERGSLSQREFRELEVKLDFARIDLTILKEPDREKECRLLKAKLRAAYATELREVQERLYQSGSKSRAALDMAIFVEDTANLNVKYLQSEDDDRKKNFILFKIAARKVQFAEKVLELDQLLYERGSLGRLDFENSQTQLELAQLELAERRKVMGATARVLNDDKVPSD